MTLLAAMSEYLRPARVRAAVLACVLAGGVTGVALGLGWTLLAVVPVAIALVFLLSESPTAPYGVVLLAVCSLVWWGAYPRVQLGGAQVSVVEGVLVVCVAAVILRWALGGLDLAINDRTDIVLVCVVAAASVGGILVSVLHGATLMDSLKSIESPAFYVSIVPAVVALASVRSRKRITRFALGLAVLVTLAQVLQVIVGPERPLFYLGGFQDLIAMDPGTNILRVRSPGLTLVYIVMAFALAAVVWGPRERRARFAIVFALTTAGVLVSLNRNMVLGMIAGFLVALVFARQRTRGVLALILAAVVLTSTLIVLGGDTSSAITQRFVGSLTESAAIVDTLADREYENGYAIATLEREPLTGVGWGASYGARVSPNPLNDLYDDARPWLHNQYLYLWLRMGIVGLLAVVALLVRTVLAGAKWSRRANDGSGWLGLGLIIAVVAMSASSLVGMYLTNPDSVVPLSGLLALGFVLRNSAPAPSPADTLGGSLPPALGNDGG